MRASVFHARASLCPAQSNCADSVRSPRPRSSVYSLGHEPAGAELPGRALDEFPVEEERHEAGGLGHRRGLVADAVQRPGMRQLADPRRLVARVHGREVQIVDEVCAAEWILRDSASARPVGWGDCGGCRRARGFAFGPAVNGERFAVGRWRVEQTGRWNAATAWGTAVAQSGSRPCPSWAPPSSPWSVERARARFPPAPASGGQLDRRRRLRTASRDRSAAARTARRGAGRGRGRPQQRASCPVRVMASLTRKYPSAED